MPAVSIGLILIWELGSRHVLMNLCWNIVSLFNANARLGFNGESAHSLAKAISLDFLKRAWASFYFKRTCKSFTGSLIPFLYSLSDDL